MVNKTSLAWLYFVSRRFAHVDRRGRVALMTVLSTVGIAFGVMTLIVVMAVMNGFQLGSIESILELHSYHIQAYPKNHAEETLLMHKAPALVRSITPFMEAKALVVGAKQRQQASLVRFLPETVMDTDLGFAQQITIVQGTFDLSEGQAVLGYGLATSLGLKVGDEVTLVAVSGNAHAALISHTRKFVVSGIFHTSYSDISNSFLFLSLAEGKKIAGENTVPTYGIKLDNPERDSLVLNKLRNILGNQTFESWRSYNRSFFGALRMEKNILFLLMLLIFLVVAVNIFNSMRRMIFERREDIAVLSALGAKRFLIQGIFIMQGLFIGITGAIPGMVLGIIISSNISYVFIIISKLTYYVTYWVTFIFSKSTLYYVTENPMFRFYAQIPTRMFLNETILITLFGIFSALCATWVAGAKVSSLSIAQVLRYE